MDSFGTACTSLATHFIACLRVTGMVAADDCVPSAVKYAGSMVMRSLNGFFLTTMPAMAYCNRSKENVHGKDHEYYFHEC